ncbi:hypothetical protein QQF64_001642 [Cirrhinus molitorella]|uniref:Uncharacterized protein n=1 Tax=Cirrhinus molitorella TaxID=172907 RepID=A0ABR3P0N4_9TELE
MLERFTEDIFSQHLVLLFLQQLSSANPPATSCLPRYKHTGPGATGGTGRAAKPNTLHLLPTTTKPPAHAHCSCRPMRKRDGSRAGHTGVDGNLTSSVNS